jgi:nitrous oxidase accessory protein NosD
MRQTSIYLAFVLACFCHCGGYAFAQDQTPGKQRIDSEKLYLLGFDGVLDASNRFYLDRLEVADLKNESLVKNEQKLLEQWWDITDRSSLIETLLWFAKEGHRNSFEGQVHAISRANEFEYRGLIDHYKDSEHALYRLFMARNHSNMFQSGKMLAWDMTRAVSVIRRAYTAGYIDEAEAWRFLEGLELPKKIKQTYGGSWEDYGKHYLAGRNYWSKESSNEADSRMRFGYLVLSEMKYSPWNRYKNMEYEAVSLPASFAEITAVPDVKIEYPANIINSAEDYPDATIVSSASEIYKAAADPECKIIFVNEGTYKLDKGIVLGEGQSIIGASRNKVVFEFDTINNFLIKAMAGHCSLDSITIKDTRSSYDSPRAKYFAGILTVKDECDVKNCVLENMPRVPVFVEVNCKMLVDKCIIQRTNSIFCEGNELTILNSFIDAQNGTAVRIHTCISFRLEDNIIRAAGKYGVYCNKADSVVVSNNSVLDCASSGIRINNAQSSLVIENNLCINNVGNGVSVNDSPKGLIKNNRCFLNELDGVYVKCPSGNIRLVSNECSRNGNNGIIAGSGFIEISDNICSDNAGAGIRCMTSTDLKNNKVYRNRNHGLDMYSGTGNLTGNIAANNYYAGIFVASEVKKINAVNNELNDNLWAGAYIRSKSDDIKFTGNVCNNNGAWPVVCYGEGVEPKFADNTFSGNFRGNEVERKLDQVTYLDEFEKFCKEMGIDKKNWKKQ